VQHHEQPYLKRAMIRPVGPTADRGNSARRRTDAWCNRPRYLPAQTRSMQRRQDCCCRTCCKTWLPPSARVANRNTVSSSHRAFGTGGDTSLPLCRRLADARRLLNTGLRRVAALSLLATGDSTGLQQESSVRLTGAYLTETLSVLQSDVCGVASCQRPRAT